MRLGFHVSISGGFSLSVQRAFELGCTCMQIFSRNPRGWTVKPLDKTDVAEFKEASATNTILLLSFVPTNYRHQPRVVEALICTKNPSNSSSLTSNAPRHSARNIW